MVAVTQDLAFSQTMPLALASLNGISEQLLFLDTEFTSLDWSTSKLIALQVGTLNGPVVVHDLRRESETTIRRLLASLDIAHQTVVCHNANADLHMLAQYGVYPRAVRDTQVMTLLLEGRGGYVSLKDALATYCPHITVQKETRDVFVDMDQRPDDWNRPFTLQELDYMRLDVRSMMELYHALVEQLKLAPLRLQRVVDLEHALIPVIVRMEHAGLYVDVPRWKAFIHDAEVERQRLEAELEQRLGVPWALEARDRFERENQALLVWAQAKKDNEDRLRAQYTSAGVQDMGVTWGVYKQTHMATWREARPRPVIKKPASDAFVLNLSSTTQLAEAFKLSYDVTFESLAAPYLASRLPILGPECAETVRLLLDYKAATKLVTAFGDKFLAHVKADGRIHARFNAMGTDTGRMSCDTPNLQQVPRPRKLADLRSCIRASAGRVLLVADLSNAELRILANESQDAGMLAIFERGEDMHSAVARKMFRLSDDQNPKELFVKDGVSYRHVAKTIAFGLAYGMGPGKLAATLGVEGDEAKRLILAFFAEFPGVKEYLDGLARHAQEQGYAITRLGRWRKLPIGKAPSGISWSHGRPYDRLHTVETNAWMERYAEVGRLGKNTPIQGGCADVVKAALVDLDESLATYQVGADIVSCIHDEVVVEALEAQASFAAHLLSESMTSAFRTLYPNVRFDNVEVARSDTWVH